MAEIGKVMFFAMSFYLVEETVMNKIYRCISQGRLWEILQDKNKMSAKDKSLILNGSMEKKKVYGL